MAADQMMPGPDGAPVKCYRRRAANVVTGDYLPEYGAHVVCDALSDPEDGAQWVTLDNGQDVRFTARGKVWLFRTYAAPEWLLEARDSWRAAYDMWTERAESGASAPLSVAGADSGTVCYQLSRDEYRRAYPAPMLSDFVRETCAARRAS